jgi:riboflavin kinase/FMN adenylyltransferase
MQVVDNLAEVQLSYDSVLTIGAFDGVHRGHQYLITRLVARARQTNRLAGLITFHPHPSVVLSDREPARYLTTPGEKAALLEKLGLDIVAILPFDQEIAQTPAREFIEMTRRYLRMAEMWMGADFALGHNCEGNVSVLQTMGKELGFTVKVVEPLVWEGQIISSTRIRTLLFKGLVREAARLLNRYPSLAGEVVQGAQRGRCMGFPTANLNVRAERAIPADGVYAAYALLGEERYQGVVTIGVRPSFDNGERTVETHILDFKGNIYGCDLVVEFVERLRSEQRFVDIEDLRKRIAQDIAQTRSILATEEPAFPFSLPAPKEPVPYPIKAT